MRSHRICALLAALLMVCVVSTAVAAAGMMTSEEMENKYNEAVMGLVTYLESYGNGSANLERTLELSIRKYNLSRGVTKTSTHLFRHTFAKNYILAGGGMIQLQAILGHSTLDMTRKYVNLYGTDIQRDFDRLNPLNHILAKGQ